MAIFYLRKVSCWLGLAIGLGSISGCAVIGQTSSFDDGRYRLTRTDDPALQALVPHHRTVYVQRQEDTLLLTRDEVATALTATQRYRLLPGQHTTLLKRSLDLNIFTIPFKVHPAREGYPLQLNTNFNAAIYVGQRFDYFRFSQRQLNPFRRSTIVQNTGIGYGAFFGLGSANITHDLTGHQAVTDYEGLVLHSGIAAIYDVRAFNVGLALGIDHLIGPDASAWIYQHQPWLGLLFSVDLN